MQSGADADDVDDGVEGTDFVKVDGDVCRAVNVRLSVGQAGEDGAGAALDLRGKS